MPGPLNIQPKRKQNSREALLEAAGALFLEKGYEAVSTREIAEIAGVNLGAIQYHFGSKANLFLQTVQSMMEGCGCSGGWFVTRELEGRQHAMQELGRFIASFMTYLLYQNDANPCRLMFREIFSETTQDKELCEGIVSAVVSDFIRPVDDALRALVQQIAPEQTVEEVRRGARSIIGQCSFYVTHRPFIERLNNQSFTDHHVFQQTVEHVCTFSLRGLKASEEEIAAAVKAIEFPTTCQQEQKNK